MLANFVLLNLDLMTDDIAIFDLQFDYDYCEPKITYAKSIIYILINDVKILITWFWSIGNLHIF